MRDRLLRSSTGRRLGSCVGVFAMLSARSTTDPPRRSRRRGVSLIELLVVLAIMLLVFAMSGVLIGPPLKKARIASLANEIAVLAKRVPVEVHSFESGRHGLGLAGDTPDVAPWGPMCVRFLKRHLEK